MPVWAGAPWDEWDGNRRKGFPFFFIKVANHGITGAPNTRKKENPRAGFSAAAFLFPGNDAEDTT